jgi:transketolase
MKNAFEPDLLKLEMIARDIRDELSRVTPSENGGKPVISTSAVDLLTTLFFHHMNLDPNNPLFPESDRFIFSCDLFLPAVSSALISSGYKQRGELQSLLSGKARLKDNPDKFVSSFVEGISGSAGEGLSAAEQLALAGKMNCYNYRVVYLINSVEKLDRLFWKCAVSAPRFCLDNLVLVMEYGKRLYSDGRDLLDVNYMVKKFQDLNWDISRIDGHDLNAINEALLLSKRKTGKPTLIAALTSDTDDKSFYEENADWFNWQNILDVTPADPDSYMAAQTDKRADFSDDDINNRPV